METTVSDVFVEGTTCDVRGCGEPGVFKVMLWSYVGDRGELKAVYWLCVRHADVYAMSDRKLITAADRKRELMLMEMGVPQKIHVGGLPGLEPG